MQENVTIRAVDESVLPVVEKSVRSSYGRSHALELQDQLRGLLTFYVAWMDEVPVGSTFVSWTGPRDLDVRRSYPECPEIYRLGVDEQFRAQGIGTQLIRQCECSATAKGFAQIGLGVSHDNLRALQLYLRLGYVQSSVDKYMDEYQIVVPDGSVKSVCEPLLFMIKDLAG